MEPFSTWPMAAIAAELRREDDLRRYEHLRKHNLLADVPHTPGVRATLAAWMLRAAVRLDRHAVDAVPRQRVATTA